MKSLGQKLLGAFVCLLVLIVGAAWKRGDPQSAQPAPATPAGERAVTPAQGADRQITLDVVVTDHSGKPVAGLQQQDFTVLDDKRPRTISSFSALAKTRGSEDLPEQSVVVVDAVNTPFNAIAYQREQLDRFLRQLGSELPLPMSVSVLTDKSASQSPASSDGNTVANSLDAAQSGLRIINRAQGFYGAQERFQISLPALNRLVDGVAMQPGRKLVIWVGPGWPLLSGPGMEMMIARKDQAQIFSSIVKLSSALRQGRVTLYNVDQPGSGESMSRAFYYQEFLKGVSSANMAQFGNLALQVLAVQSGGLVLNRSNDLGSSVAACLADGQAFYTLAFEAPTANSPDEYHSLQVKMNQHGLTARTRTGYYAQP
jgi:VWFA-related protein